MSRNLYAVVEASKRMDNMASSWVHGYIDRIYFDSNSAKERIDELAKELKAFYTEDSDYEIKMEIYDPGKSFTIRTYDKFRNRDTVERYTVEKTFIYDEP